MATAPEQPIDSEQAEPSSARLVQRDRRYAGASRAERDAARRVRLLDAGLDVFGTDGYAPTTIEGLCARAGVSTRHFYDHFRSREDLLVAVYDRIIADLRNRVVGALGTLDDLDLEAQMRAGVTAYVVPLLADERMPRVVHLEVIGVSPALEHHRRGMIHAFAALIETEALRLMDADAIARRDVRLVSLGLVGATTELMVDWVMGAPRAPVDRLVEEIVHIYVASLS